MSHTEQAAAYDAVAYPTGVFRRTHPNRMAVLARLHGLTPPDIRTARVLEIAGGDGMNVINLAAAYPDGRYRSFDIAPSAVARGAAWVRDAGLAQVEVAQGDIVDAAETLDGPFDYVIAHGIYAWVPDNVRDAVMRLIGRVLAPDGVAVVTYNTLPGAHLRLALREMLLDRLAGIDGVPARMAAAAELLEAYGTPREKDAPFVAALREQARALAERPSAVLWHDELNPDYHPQSVGAVARAAQAAGLQFLGDADQPRIEDGFLPDADEDRSTARAIAAVQAGDYEQLRMFRHTLLVRAGVPLKRFLTSAPLADMHLSIEATRTGPSGFAQGSTTFEISDADLAAKIETVAKHHPHTVPVASVFGGAELDLVFRLFQRGIAELWTVPPGFVAAAGERPTASIVARLLAGAGATRFPTLDQREVVMADPGPRAFFALLDGTRDRARLAEDWAASPDFDGIDVDTGLRAMARSALLVG